MGCQEAAKGGHLEVLKWLREEGCPWDEVTCYVAAANNELGVLRWALENECPYRERYIRRVEDVEFLEWFERHRTSFQVIEEEESSDGSSDDDDSEDDN